MGKYFTYFYLSVLDQLEYRADLVTKIIFRVIPVVGFYYLWKTLYLSGARYGNYGFRELATYFLISTVIDLITPTFMAIDNLSENVRTGFLSATLLKPVSYMPFQLANFLGERLTRLVAAMAVVAAAVLLFGRSLSFSTNPWLWSAFALSVGLSVVLAYSVFFVFSVVSFWTTRVVGVAFAIVTVTGFLSGNVIPLDLLPLSLQWLTGILPFKYIVFFPTRVFLNVLGPEEIVKGILLQLLWILMAIFLAKRVWVIGLRKYESVGA